ncbi:hypothetical protein RND71_003894 [Anisodus tanguticus]|uniref:Uncharacterized protein n=1 Tax=Anisodus tanguticus TaxID=243964 RepID=A0AAE1SXL7_9SOLA|nr:hypothetical protein RND71_003894 [Anisodus tanguticus]
MEIGERGHSRQAKKNKQQWTYSTLIREKNNAHGSESRIKSAPQLKHNRKTLSIILYLIKYVINGSSPLSRKNVRNGKIFRDNNTNMHASQAINKAIQYKFMNEKSKCSPTKTTLYIKTSTNLNMDGSCMGNPGKGV